VNATSNSIEVAVRPGGDCWRTDFADESITATADKLKGIEPELVVLEGTGTYELTLAGVFATLGLPFAIVNPRSVRDFARAVGRLTRGDYNQAGLLAHFGELVHPEARPIGTEIIQKLKELRARRSDILKMLAVERDRLCRASSVVRKDLQRHIEFWKRALVCWTRSSVAPSRLSSAWR
jgi:transposase